MQALENSDSLLQFHFKNYVGDLQTTAGKSAFVNEVLIELAKIKDPVVRELHARTLSELIKISISSILDALQTQLNQKKNTARFKNNDNKTLTNKIENKSLVEDDLIRLCFTDNAEIRKYLYDNVNPDWLTSDIITTIFDKVYIHLFASNAPEAGLIMDELTEKNHRNKLAEIIIDLEKIDASMGSTYDCIRRLEENWINSQLKILRESLKNAEATNQDPISIMKKIEDLQKEKNKLSQISPANET